LDYIVDDGEKSFAYMYNREDGGAQLHATFKKCGVHFEDARPKAKELALDKQGVILVPHTTKLTTSDFYDHPEKVWGQYYAEIRALLKQVTGASRVIVFDHNVRNPQRAKWHRGVISYVPYAHNDYTTLSGLQRVRDCAVARPFTDVATACEEGVIHEEELEALLQGRYILINAWRNISEMPIVRDPLGVADGRTIRNEHYITTDLVHRDRQGQTYSVTEDPEHHWMYFSDMRKDEILLFKCYDSLESLDVLRWTAHTGFCDPRAPSNAPLRESVDARCICFFTEGDEAKMTKSAGELFPDWQPTVQPWN